MNLTRYRNHLTGSLLLLLAACSSSTAPAPAEHAADESKGAHGLTLDAAQREKIGLKTAPAAAASFLAESPGYGVVIGHEAIAVASAEVATAQAAVRQSHAAVARAHALAGTPGAFSLETAEAAERQAAADSAALSLAQRRLTALLGQSDAVNADGSALLPELATGRVKLVRVTFPLGALPSSLPRHLRLKRLDASAGARNWTSDSVWEAPADATIPGRSLFALLQAGDVSEGERLEAWAPTSTNLKGAIVPASAVIQSNSTYWCYIEKPAGTFVRTAIDTDRPAPGGYFVTAGVAAGDTVVTGGAGLLLARETNPSTEAEE